MISFEQALNIVKEKLSLAPPSPKTEVVPLGEAAGHILAEDVSADRDYPPFHRSIRDGFAVRAADLSSLPVVLSLRGEVRAGLRYQGHLEAGECVSIMTGAPLPPGADAVVMLEHVKANGDKVEFGKSVSAGDNVVHQGSEARLGQRVLKQGKRLDAGDIGLLATVGRARITAFTRPEVAILATGDELVPVEARPEWFQVRNSNALALSAQVAAAGGIPRPLGVAPDRPETLGALIREGLAADLLLLSGGISVGKYDFVARALTDLGAEFYFHGVALRPGKPLAFGRVGRTLFFALPGNPVSTFVTFELFARPALATLAGAEFQSSIFLRARLGKSCVQKGGLTVFLPATLEQHSGDAKVSPVDWQGSGDLVAVANANCFLVMHPRQTRLEAGDWVDVMPKEH